MPLLFPNAYCSLQQNSLSFHMVFPYTMDSEAEPQKSTSTRFKCSACYSQYKKKEHLIKHMKVSYHSVHQPMCGVCGKHCRTFESLREHLIGRLSKASCASIFLNRGCDLCMKVFSSSDAFTSHKRTCFLSPKPPMGSVSLPTLEYELEVFKLNEASRIGKAVAIDCEMVGGGSDGLYDICARVCLIDENENLIFNAYVRPEIPVTDYRYEVTGLKEEHLRDAMPLQQVQEKILEILHNGESVWRVRSDGGKGRLLVGHSLDHDLYCLHMYYPDHMLRDTAKYYPLMKTNLSSHSLKYLTKTYLGYEIQSGTHVPYEDCVAVMRIYKRMRAQDHQIEVMPASTPTQPTCSNVFDLVESQLEEMSPDDLLSISRSKYSCWCLDSRPKQEV